MNGFSALFIRRPVGTILLSLGLLVAGCVAYFFLPVASLPNVDFPTIRVMAGRPGADPSTMAATVAAPLERSLSTISGVTEMTSSSTLGSTSITVQFDLARKAIAARFTAREAGDHMIHPHIRHFLCGLHRRANGAFGFIHGADLAKAHPARAGRGRPDDAEVRLTRHRPHTINIARFVKPVKAQDQTGDLRGAHIQNRNHAPLQGSFAQIPHGTLGLVQVGHDFDSVGTLIP